MLCPASHHCHIPACLLGILSLQLRLGDLTALNGNYYSWWLDPSSFLFTKSVFLPCSKNLQAIASRGQCPKRRKVACLYHFLSPELSPLLRVLVVGEERVEGDHWVCLRPCPFGNQVLVPPPHLRPCVLHRLLWNQIQWNPVRFAVILGLCFLHWGRKAFGVHGP